MAILKLLFGLSGPFLAGFIIFTYKKGSFSFPERLALAYGAGMGILSLVMFYISSFKIKFTVWNIFLGFLLIAGLFSLLSIKSSGASGKRQLIQLGRTSLTEKLLIGFIVLVFLYVLFEALICPLTVMVDSWAIYGFKAKAFYLSHTVPPDFFKDSTKAFSHLDYPLLVPLSETWLYLCLGSWNDQLVKVIFPLYYISLVVIFYCSLRYYIDKKTALLSTAFLSAIPQVVYWSSSGYADLPFTFYYFTSLIFLFRAYRDLDRNLLFISSVFSGLACWTKNEGLTISLFNILILFYAILIQGKLNRRTIIILAKYALVVFAIIFPWIYFTHSLGLSNDVINPGNLTLANVFNNLKRLPVILTAIAGNMFIFKFWNLLWYLSIGLFIINIRKIAKLPLSLILFSILLCLTSWIFVYVITPHGLKWHLASSVDRLLFDIAPLALFMDALLVFSGNKKLV